MSCAWAAYRSLIRASHASVQYFSWAGFASPARTKYRRIWALWRILHKAQYAESGIMRNGAAWVRGLAGGAGLGRVIPSWRGVRRGGPRECPFFELKVCVEVDLDCSQVLVAQP